MHIIVLGAGVAGVSTAWYLAKAGHQVTVMDRAEAAAMGNQLCQCRPALRMATPRRRGRHRAFRKKRSNRFSGRIRR